MTSHLSHQLSEPAYHIVDCRIFGPWDPRLLAVKNYSSHFRYLYYLRILCIKIKLFAISLTSENKHVVLLLFRRSMTIFTNKNKSRMINCYRCSFDEKKNHYSLDRGSQGCSRSKIIQAISGICTTYLYFALK